MPWNFEKPERRQEWEEKAAIRKKPLDHGYLPWDDRSDQRTKTPIGRRRK